MNLTVKRTESPTPGMTQYAVTRDGAILGYAERRRGGWWRATDAAGRCRGSWYSTRREAVAALSEAS